MAARTKSKVTQYRVTNWPAYEAALRKRGDITRWFDQEAIDAWNAPATGRAGGQPRYSDLAIVTALTLRALFRLPLRQTEGFVASLVRMMDLNLATPDHTPQCPGRGPEICSASRRTNSPGHRLDGTENRR
jgi:hypothetical protein